MFMVMKLKVSYMFNWPVFIFSAGKGQISQKLSSDFFSFELGYFLEEGSGGEREGSFSSQRHQ